MKKYLLTLAALVVVAGGALATSNVQAQSEFASNDDGQITLTKDQVVDGAYYATGQDVVVNGTVKGDLYCAAQTVQVNGTVEGDVLCAAQNIKIAGTVGQDVRSAAQTVTVSGEVGGTVTSFAQTVKIAKGATVGGNLNGAGQTVNVDGTVQRDVAIGSDKLSITGLVEGSVRADVSSLALSSSPAIKGNLEYSSTDKQEIAKGAVAGDVKFDKVAVSDAETKTASDKSLVTPLFMVLTLIATSVVVALLVPRYLERSHNLVRRKIGLVILAGIAINLGTPILGIALMLTGVGLPLALVLFAAVFALNILAFPFAAYYLSRTFFDQLIRNVVLLMIVGSLVLVILLALPFVGFLVFLITATVGVGGLAITMTNGYQRPHYTLEEATPARVKTSRKK